MFEPFEEEEDTLVSHRSMKLTTAEFKWVLKNMDSGGFLAKCRSIL